MSKPRKGNDHEGVSLNCGVITKKMRMNIRYISKENGVKTKKGNDHEGVSQNYGFITRKMRMTIRCVSK